MDDLREACEAFCCGTGAAVTPVGRVSLTSREDPESEIAPTIVFGDGETPGPITERLYELLLGIQFGQSDELNARYGNWIHVVDP